MFQITASKNLRPIVYLAVNPILASLSPNVATSVLVEMAKTVGFDFQTKSTADGHTDEVASYSFLWEMHKTPALEHGKRNSVS